ncbi:MAG: hypothetical protein ACKORK_01820, partial [Gemmatimonadota bacterium]
VGLQWVKIGTQAPGDPSVTPIDPPEALDPATLGYLNLWSQSLGGPTAYVHGETTAAPAPIRPNPRLPAKNTLTTARRHNTGYPGAEPARTSSAWTGYPPSISIDADSLGFDSRRRAWEYIDR